jgi:hypothetical protein
MSHITSTAGACDSRQMSLTLTDATAIAVDESTYLQHLLCMDGALYLSIYGAVQRHTPPPRARTRPLLRTTAEGRPLLMLTMPDVYRQWRWPSRPHRRPRAGEVGVAGVLPEFDAA